MEFQEFPKLLYLNGNIESEYKIAFDKTEESALSDSGFICMKEQAPKKSELAEKAESLGIKVDARWGEARLMAEIEKAS